MGSSTVQVKEGSAEPTADPAAALRGGVELVWTALVEPSPEELAAAVAALGMPAALLEESRAGSPDVLRPGAPAHRRRARLVELGEGRGVVLLPAAYDDEDEQVGLGLLTVLVDGQAVLSIARGPAPDLSRLQAEAHRHLEHSGQLLQAIVIAVLEGYDAVLEGLDEDVLDTEQQVFSSERRSHAKRIYGLKRESLELERAVTPLDDMVTRLQCAPAVHDRVLRVTEHLDRLGDLLDSVLSADLAQVGVRQNEDQRRISAWAAIGLVPTVVAGIYGMNFQHMPELSWRFGYPAALALVLTLCTCLYVGFRRNGWLGDQTQD